MQMIGNFEAKRNLYDILSLLLLVQKRRFRATFDAIKKQLVVLCLFVLLF